MARRRGKKGDYLISDDYTGFTTYRSQVKEDYWGNLTVKPLKRNLQEIASPLNDPVPVTVYRGPTYEQVNPCNFEIQPLFIGKTNIRTPNNSPATQANDWDPAIPNMQVGCTFEIR